MTDLAQDHVMEQKIISDTDPTGQRWLPSMPSPICARVADVCLHKFCREFLDKCPLPTVSSLSIELDDLSLACVLLATEWGHRSLDSTSASLQACLDKVHGRFWGDLLPWQLALEFCRYNPSGASGLGNVTCNLDHHNSSIRLWMFDLAWCVRDRLNREKAVPRLLKNVANTLGFWDSSLGLCRALFPSDEAFLLAAEEFEADTFSIQFRDRLESARKEGLATFQSRFERKELRLRRQICQIALAVTPDEMQTIEVSNK